MKNIEIIGSGYAIAKHCITNHHLEKVIDTSDEWIVARTGIQTRYVSDDENTSDLGYRASKNAIEKSGIDPNDIDLIIVATMTPDHFTPSCACLIQEKLGLNNNHIMAFDINAACSGFIYAMQVASSMLGAYNCALVIGAETLSKIIDWQDRNTCVLFGDGAGALIMKYQENNKEIYHYAKSIGDNQGILKAEGIPLHAPLHNAENRFGYLKMEGNEVFRFAVKAMEHGINEVLKQSGLTLDDIDLIIPHQANLRIIAYVAKRMKIDQDKFYTNLHQFGNTSAASVAIAYAQASQQGIIKSGMKIILVGFGAGFTYGASLLEL